ncbi:hypothetical protein K435DRAFT_967480 [Dendrothele bispora CBS 962.96]|uniref:CENP-V/GFA domain-containing protein n=1 Tax=Dendrothele bispora (strain CBS 962.96) TaxID=1314807 RepID=A0A4S8LTX8_DENBC|nr:hypothetical protein K435DRAFT_967480 [Dendrothele bispora CBS 962.96]
MSSSQTREGTCLCEANKFTVKGDPMSYFVCHCSNCKKQAGSAFTACVVFKDENIDLTGSQNMGQFADSKTKSGSTMIRHFCNKCGSTMLARPDQNHLPNNWIVPASLIEGHEAWTPQKEFFSENKCAFVKDLEIISTDKA